MEYTKTRFYIDQALYRQYARNFKGEHLVIKIENNNSQNSHPVGKYKIPFDAAIAFIKSKIFENGNDGPYTFNWQHNKTWHSASIPVPLRNYFLQ